MKGNYHHLMDLITTTIRCHGILWWDEKAQHKIADRIACDAIKKGFLKTPRHLVGFVIKSLKAIKAADKCPS